jgi:1,4-dihydroxy-2-naphthoate octaprenyltransferase
MLCYDFPQLIFTLLFQSGTNVSNDFTDCVMAGTSHSLKSSQKPGWGVLSAIHRARNSHQMYGNLLFVFFFVFKMKGHQIQAKRTHNLVEIGITASKASNGRLIQGSLK